MRNIALVSLITAAALLSGCAVHRDQQTIGMYVDDVTITTTIKSRLAASPLASLTAIKVETLNGVVQLSGFAKSVEEKQEAVELARSTRNVQRVIDSIIVPE